MPPWTEYFALLDRGAEPEGTPFLMTDAEEELDAFRSRYGERLFWREQPRSLKATEEFHINYRQTREDVEHCFTDVLCLAGCQRLVHPVSNLATAALYINPSLESHFIQAGTA